MEEESFPMDGEEHIKQEASDWIAKQDLGFKPEEQDAFFEWLGADPRHGEAYSARKSMWSELNVLAEWKPQHSIEPNPDLLAVPPSRSVIRWVSVISAFAAVFVIGLLISNPWTETKEEGPFLLAAGEGALFYEYHVMEDGTIIELNRGTQISVDYQSHKRSIKLMSGEAHFTVAKDAERPFIVQARNTLVEAIGTAFNVSMNSEEIEVVVTEGRVVMSPSVVIESEDEVEELRDYSQELIAGQRSLLSIQESFSFPLVEEISTTQIARRLAWKDEAINFTAVPLSEVILEFNRRNHTQIVIGDSSIAAREITAILQPSNLDGFIEMIGISFNIHSTKDGDSKIILHSGE